MTWCIHITTGPKGLPMTIAGDTTDGAKGVEFIELIKIDEGKVRSTWRTWFENR